MLELSILNLQRLVAHCLELLLIRLHPFFIPWPLQELSLLYFTLMA